MKTLEDLRKNIELVKQLIYQKDTNKIIKFIDDSQTIFSENNYFLVDLNINNIISIHIYHHERVAVCYNGLSSDNISESVELYDFVDSFKKEIKDIFFDNVKDKKDTLISDLLDLTGYKFTICTCVKGVLIKVSDGYFGFQYSVECNAFAMHSELSSFIVFYDNTDGSYDLFKRLDTYKETHKYIKELLENYIKEL